MAKQARYLIQFPKPRQKKERLQAPIMKALKGVYFWVLCPNPGTLSLVRSLCEKAQCSFQAAAIPSGVLEEGRF